MRKRMSLFMTSLFISISLMTAQVVNVGGIVVSAEDGEPIIGASVLVKGTTTGTITDVDGKFNFNNLSASATSLIVSYVGMKTQEVQIQKTAMRIELATDTEVLDEVVVTAMGIKRSEKALGYAATSVKADRITETRTSDVMSGLAGKIAGVQISTTSSDPGSSTSVVIRGVSSLSGSNQPLYVVDGVPLNNTSIRSSDGLNSGFDFGNGANAINPDDVENMTILKGAAATALYGSRAANGVVMITTKSGKKNQGIGIEYNGGVQWSTILRLPEFQNEFGMGWNGNHTELENGSWGPRLDGSMQLWGNIYNNSQKLKPFLAQENNVRDFFDAGFRYSNSLSFNGATDRSNYFVSFSQISDDGMIPTDADSYDKYTFSARGSHKVGNLTFSSSLNYSFQKNDFATTGQGLSMLNSIYQTPRDVSIIGLQDMNDPFNTPGYYYTPYGVTNPYYILENYLNSYESERFYGKFQMDYDFLKYFKFTYRMGLDTSTGQNDRGVPNLYALFYENTPNGDGQGASSPFSGETGSYTQRITRQREINQDLMVSFDMPINDFRINAIVGFNGNERKYSYQDVEVRDLTIPTWFNLSNSSSTPSVTTYQEMRRLMGVFGQFEASWKDMLYLTLTARNDWSSTLPKENRSFFYPGFTTSFIFSELLGDGVRDWLSFGKVRASWGKTGNDADVYMVNPVYGQSAISIPFGSLLFPLNGVNAFSAGNTLGSNTLSPEMTTEYELGLNMAFFNNRLSFDAAYYNRNSDRQIFSLNMDPATGYTYQNMNLGKIRNQGIEALVNITPIQMKNFSWELGLNITKNWSKVISLPEQLGGQASIFGFSGGTGMYAITGYPVGVFRAEVAARDPEGHIIVNSSTGLPVAADEYAIVGDMNNKYQLGLSTTLRYKGWTLSADFDIRKGGIMYSRTKDINYFTGNAIQTAYNDRNTFIVPNSVNRVTDSNGNVTYVENTTPITGSNIYAYWGAGGDGMGSASLIDKSFVKLRSLVLGWDVPKKWLAKTPITELRLSAYGNNLFLWTPSDNTFIDPETTSFGNDLAGNFGEYTANPSSRRFGFNLMVKF
ncbi:SusC/RagA family TonB-linked outer membrane protein [Bacteroides intestinalis]|uniref:TonB-dependent receptor plug domain protein n=1 Tax=Bacteroides intestinalis TaxID=329854 RepID=A0A139KM72_9BACE|nr:SusC/RagA family TonB-linked outer membrane protein [Bacteroides intestinalis]KXT40280.1 TonB-dependent receptor plug domain protein [Bacteroides intestinalis]